MAPVLVLVLVVMRPRAASLIRCALVSPRADRRALGSSVANGRRQLTPQVTSHVVRAPARTTDSTSASRSS